jgi:beta-lactam-binding protein with PASTA domain
VNVNVSKGPATSTVPDVTSLDLGSAQQTLHDSGFSAHVVYQDTADPNSVGLVLAQDPPGSTQLKPNAVVTLTVGRQPATTPPGTTTDTTQTP